MNWAKLKWIALALIAVLIVSGCTGPQQAQPPAAKGIESLKTPLPDLEAPEDLNVDFGLGAISNPLPSSLPTGK